MRKLTNYLAIAVLLIGVAVFSFLFQNPLGAKASIDGDSGYVATTTSSTWLDQKTKALRVGQGTLGSVVVTGATAGDTIILYNATTTNASLRKASLSTTTITLATFSANTPADTYTFDVNFTDGLMVEIGGSSTGIGSTTITFK